VVGDSIQVYATLPNVALQFHVPEKVLQRRMVVKGDRPVHQGLIQWTQSPASLATREDLQALQYQFPRVPAWGTNMFYWREQC
jgi:hypothetical protein